MISGDLGFKLGHILSKTPCGRVPPPPASEEILKEILGEALKLDTESFQKVFRKLLRVCPKMGPKTVKIEVWRGSGRSWKRSWHENRLAGCLGRFWPILDRRGMPKMAARWPNLAPRWGQDRAKMAQDGAWLAILRLILAILGGLGSDLQKNGRSVKTNNSPAFWLHFGVLGGVLGGSWGVF